MEVPPLLRVLGIDLDTPQTGGINKFADALSARALPRPSTVAILDGIGAFFSSLLLSSSGAPSACRWFWL